MDALLPVMDKLEEAGFDIMYNKSGCWVFLNSSLPEITHVGGSRIQNVFMAVSDCITKVLVDVRGIRGKTGERGNE
jgi:hypothetical protein